MGKRASFNKITSMAVLTMFSLGMFTVSPEAEVYSDDLIKNNSFDRYLDGFAIHFAFLDLQFLLHIFLLA